ncbi:MAG: methyltransferase [Bacteroidetes bacterium]|nr:MAG: methyltransferase [Bacteroidota bacterium]
MRIIGGQHAGYIIRPPKNIQARPTTDIAKEALFNILNNRLDFEGAKVLDLFAGAGNISLEFSSRGAQEVVAVDSSTVTLSFLKQVKKELSLDCLLPLKGDAYKYLQNAAAKYDVIFADPPYAMQNINTIPQLVFERQLLHQDGLLIIEHNSNVRLPHDCLVETRKYGQSAFSFYANQPH